MIEPQSAAAPNSEQQLLQGLLNKDAQAFEFLVEQCYGSLMAVATAIVGPVIAEEVVQESWVSVIKALPKFEGRSSLKTWITRIVANEAKKRLKRESRQINIEDLDTESSIFLDRFNEKGHWVKPTQIWSYDSPSDILNEQQLKCCIDATLTNLPAKQKAVFVMRELEAYSLDDICNILELTDSNVRVLLHRAKLKLFETIDHYQETGEC
jgi:RNA polymerase sigma-70 factor, ECF subfamily